MQKTITTLIILLLAGCVVKEPPSKEFRKFYLDRLFMAQTMVYKDQYVLDPGMAAMWCGHLDDCVEEVGDKTFAVSAIQNVAIIRGEGEPEIVPYTRENDLCLTEALGSSCSPNWYITVSYKPSDPLYGELWGMKHIKIEKAWEEGITSSAKVAVIDTGVDCDHPDLSCVGEYNAITGEEDANDDNGHGTHTIGTIGALHNQLGVSGIVDNVGVLACKFLGKSGGGSLFDAIKCIDWAIENGANIINASWGCRGCYSEALLSAIRRANDAGILFIAAAGNEGVENNGNSHHYPSDYELDNIISVGSIDQDGKLSSFSNYGSTVQIAAPGRDILSTWPGQGYKRLSGTSMATPHVAGYAALKWPITRGEILGSVSGDATRGNRRIGGRVLDASGEGETPPSCDQPRLRRCRIKCGNKFTCEFFKQRDCRKKCKKKWCK